MAGASGEVDVHMASGLSHMAAMPNYMRWIIQCFAPHLKGDIIEVGAGIGSYIPYYQPYARQVAAVEPNAAFSHYLREHYPQVEVIESTIEQLPAQYRGTFDTVLCINALEHFEQDAAAVFAMAGLLRPGGHLCIYVPARPELFSTWDASVGHFRRYSESMLRDVVKGAELEVQEMRYSDPMGGLAWYCSGKLGASPSEHDSSIGFSMRVFDKLCVPIQKSVERFWKPPWGKSLVCVAQQRRGSAVNRLKDEGIDTFRRVAANNVECSESF